ncbi:MAG TPA: hypothetical protein GXX18_04015 [Bacillales bacterium]|nr:hypothetical protein [Bacillales bacterium]
MREKIFWFGMIIVVISWVGNYLYFQSKQLERPIFLDHYYETYLQDENYLTFYYLTNKQDPSQVSYALIDGLEAYPVSNESMWHWQPNTPTFEQEFFHQYLKSVRLQLPKYDLPIEEGSDDVWTFEEITFAFSNGEMITTDIGNMNVYGKFPNSDVFETRVGSGSNQHRSDKTMVAVQPVTVDAITIPFTEEISRDVRVKVNLDQEKLKKLEAVRHGGNPPDWFEKERDLDWEKVSGVSIDEDIFPFELKKDDWLKLSMKFNPNRKSFFEFGIEINGTTAKGERFMGKAPIIDHPYLTQQAVKEIIAEKVGGANVGNE